MSRTRRWWLALLVVAVGVAAPPLTLWYYDGPRTGRTSDGLYSIFTRHEGEVALELSSFAPEAEPTRGQIEQSAALLRASTAAAERYADYSWATTEGGFSVVNATILDRPHTKYFHVWNPEFIRDGQTLNPEAPEALVYFNPGVGREMELVGLMFMSPLGVHGEQPGGNLTRWHLHEVVEFCQDSLGIPTVAARNGTAGGCPAGMSNGPTPEMMHVWLVDNPYGAFAHQMALPGEDVAGHHGRENPYVAFLRRGTLWVAERFGFRRDAFTNPTHTEHRDDATAGEGTAAGDTTGTRAVDAPSHSHP